MKHLKPITAYLLLLCLVFSLSGLTVYSEEVKSEKILPENALVFLAGTPRASVAGNIQQFYTEDKEIEAFLNGDTLYIPARFTFESLGGNVTFFPAEKRTEIILGDKKISFVTGERRYAINDRTLEMPAPAEIRRDRLFVSVQAVADCTNKKLYTDRVGFAILSDESFDLSWYDDEELIKNSLTPLVFDRPTGEEMLAAVEARHPNNGHPRLMATREDFDRIRQEIVTDPVKKNWYEQIKNQAESSLKLTPVQYGKTDGVRMIMQAYQLHDICSLGGFMYQITGDPAYAERVWQEIEAYLSWPDWNPSHFLDTAESMMGLALAYDWIYDWLSEDQKQAIISNVVEKGFKTWYGEGNRGWAGMKHNWAQHCCSGVLQMALAICDEERDVSVDVLHDSLYWLETCMMQYMPDGAWYEGSGYWSAITYWVQGVSCLETATGDDYGILNAPCISDTCYYPYALAGAYTFGFSDSTPIAVESMDGSEVLFYLGDRLGRDDIVAFRYAKMLEGKTEANLRDLIWCPSNPSTDLSHLPLDFNYRLTEVFTTRNNWSKNGSIFAGMQGGGNYATHAHLDIGSFVLDAFGDRFVWDLGLDNYTLKSKFPTFNMYRYRAEGHNTLVFNPDGRSYDQPLEAFGAFERYENNEASSLAVMDMTEAYADYAKSAKRGMKFTNGRTSVLIQDEIRSDSENEVYWFAHTKADITISEDGKTAILDMGGNKMEARILSEQGQFSVMDAKSFESTPAVEGQNANEGFRKLTIHFDKVKDIDLSVCFTPCVYIPEAGMTYPEISPLSDWRLDDPATVSVRDIPRLSDLTINGKTIADFDKERTAYKYGVHATDKTMPVITAEGDGEITVHYPDAWPGDIEIEIKNEFYKNTYRIGAVVLSESLYDKGYNKLEFSNVTASLVPQSENPPKSAKDNLLSTRYSCNMPADITFELPQVETLTDFEIAMYCGNVRKADISIEVSTDGENWTNVFNGITSGETEGFEAFSLGEVEAKYVKVIGNSLIDNATNKPIISAWFSVLEFNVYNRR